MSDYEILMIVLTVIIIVSTLLRNHDHRPSRWFVQAL